MIMSYIHKYLKYKSKYLQLQKLAGGTRPLSIKRRTINEDNDNDDYDNDDHDNGKEFLSKKSNINQIEKNLNLAKESPNLPPNAHVSQHLHVYKITCDHSGESIILEPYDEYAYFVDEPNFTSKIIVFYKLKHISRQKTIEAIIPYYVSDGQTNKFRAGMLFPFICINEQTNNSSCPKLTSESGTAGLLYKYATMQNINVSHFAKWIADEIWILRQTIVPTSDPELIKRLDIYISELALIERTTADLPSVLPRIDNLLDFLISIYSDRLFYYDTDTHIIKHVSHMANYNEVVYNNSFVPPPMGRKEIDNYNYDYDYTKSKKINTFMDIQIRPPVRILLRRLFFDMADHLKSTNLINIERRRLTLKSISLEKLNKTINVCITGNVINPDSEINYEQYVHISNNLYNLFWNKCANIMQNLESNTNRTDADEKNYNFLESFVRIKTKNKHKTATLSGNILGWAAKCSKIS